MAAPEPGPESLQFNVNWPSGLTLGEVRLAASKGETSWSYELQLDASVPGFKVFDLFKSAATDQQCSVEFERATNHGGKKTQEKTTFDRAKLQATRQTVNGGKSEFSIPACPHDALSYVYFLRRELAQGRLPGPQEVYYGGKYRVRLDYGGTQNVRVGEQSVAADRITASIKGPSSDLNLELFFAKDGARTPLLVKVPLSAGAFSVELVR